MPAEEEVCELHTRQVIALAHLFDCLRHVSPEITLCFDADAVRIAELAGTNTLYIYAELKASCFEKYAQSSEMSELAFTVSPIHVHTVLAAFTKRVRGDADVMLQLRFSRRKKFELALKSSDDADFDTSYELPCRTNKRTEEDERTAQTAAELFQAKDYGHTMYMSQRHLSHLVSHVFPLGHYIDLHCEPDAVHFSVVDQQAMISRAHVKFRMAPTAADLGSGACVGAGKKKKRRVCDDQEGTALSSAVFRFKQPLMSMLVRAMSLYNTTAVLLPQSDDTHKRPVIMQSHVGDLGALSVAIAQVTTGDDENE